MNDFEQRLQKAIDRGRRIGRQRAEAEAKAALSEAELRALHTQYRLELCDYLESCLRKLQGHLPGFRFETILSDRGWGAAVSREDFRSRSGSSSTNLYSRLELLIRPLSPYAVLDLAAKAAVRDRELFNRNFYQPLGEVDIETFRETIDRWIVEFAEAYAARTA